MPASFSSLHLRFDDDALERSFLADHCRRAVPVCRTMLLAGLGLTLAYLPFYSTISERLEPADVLAVLNEYFAAMNQLIESHGGTVLEYIGDGVMAVFNAPNALPEHAAAAVACARETQQVMRRLNADWEARALATLWQEQGVAEIAVRIGLHSGEVVVGNIGGPEQMKYGVVGDVVNVAARLEALNKPLGTSILVSAETARRLPPELAVHLTDRGAHALKGRREAELVYSVSIP